MGWQHQHWFAPTAADYFWDGTAYAFTGIFDAAYYAQRPFFVNYFNTYYRPYYLRGAYFMPGG